MRLHRLKSPTWQQFNQTARIVSNFAQWRVGLVLPPTAKRLRRRTAIKRSNA